MIKNIINNPNTHFEKVIVVPLGAKAVEIMEYIMSRSAESEAFECCSSERWDKIETSIDEKRPSAVLWPGWTHSKIQAKI